MQALLREGKNLSQIAQVLGRSRTTIGREIKLHRVEDGTKQNVCANFGKCERKAVCMYSKTCRQYRCPNDCVKCSIGCEQFEEDECKKLKTAPYVCNGCTQKSRCRLKRQMYIAKEAQKAYENMLSESRKGLFLSNNEYIFFNETIVPLIKKGISVPAVCKKYAAEMPVSDKTLYRYINDRMFEITNMDLRLVIRRRTSKRGPSSRVDMKCHEGRCYEDFEAYMNLNPEADICEMDSVIGEQGGECLLTIFFRSCDLQLMFVRKRNTAGSVTAIFEELREKLDEDFANVFNVVITDRGSEFTDPDSIERDKITGEIQLKVFYCNPMNSNQKSRCERNHEYIRYFVPKGYPFSLCKQSNINIMMNQINSIPRPKFNMQTPYELFVEKYGQSVADKLGLEAVKFEELNLKPEAIYY